MFDHHNIASTAEREKRNNTDNAVCMKCYILCRSAPVCEGVSAGMVEAVGADGKSKPGKFEYVSVSTQGSMRIG